jgi:hypothetical protein
MGDRSSRAEADLLASELEAMLDYYTWHLDIHIGKRYNSVIKRMEDLLGEPLHHLLLDDEDISSDPGKPGRSQYNAISFRSKGQAALNYFRARQLGRPVALEERYEVLATVVDAYLLDRAAFDVAWPIGGSNPVLFHPGLKEDYSPPWTHIEALAREGLLYVTELDGHHTISIPTGVLEDFHRGAGLELSMPDGQKRIDALKQSATIAYYVTNTTNVHGGSANVAYASSDFHQTANLGVSAGDLESLREVLSELGVPELALGALIDQLENVADDSSERRRAAWDWISDFASQVGSGAIGGSLANAMPGITAAINAFAD